MFRSLHLIPALALSGAALQAGSLQVTAVRAWSFPGITRVAIEVNGEFQYTSDRAHNPERLFFDLHGAVPALGSKRIVKKEVGDALVARVRVAETSPHVTRVVLDLKAPVEFTASQLSDPNRLIVELRPATPGGAPVQVTMAPPPTNATVTNIPKNAPASLTAVTQSSSAEALGPVVHPAAPPPALPLPAREANTGLARSLTRTLGLKVNRIVIDAGHGGHDQGTSGPGGLLEKDLVLDVALRLGSLVEQRMGAEVVYTRSDDTFIPLEERTAIANRNHADLFLSIHANSSPAPQVVGVETYYLNFTDSSEAMSVAARENATSNKSVFELKDLIQKISLHDKLEESKQFADAVNTSLQNFTVRSLPQAKNRGVRKAPFVVLIGANMPSVLAEIGFLTNAREESMLARQDYRQKLAEALYKGLSRYNQTLSHFEVAKQTAAPGASVTATSPAR